MPNAAAGGPLRVARLVRVSTTHLEQADSPQHQLAFLAEEISRQGWEDTGLVYEAELTGAVILDRQEIRRMLADAEAGSFGAIAMKSISRLGRDALGLLMVKRRLDDLHIELVAVADSYRSFRDPELIFLVHAERAQAGRQEIAKNVRSGSVQAARRGIWPAGGLPFGLRREGRMRIGLHPDTAPVVALIFRLRSVGRSYAEICRHLNLEARVRPPAWWHLRDRLSRLRAQPDAGEDERIQARIRDLEERVLTGRFQWQPRTIRLLLANPAYYGELQYNRTGGTRRLHGRLVREPRTPDEWVTIPCPALVSRSEWEAVQPAVRGPLRPVLNPVSPWLLAGLLTCGVCGYPLRAQAARRNSGRRGGDPKGYYVCRGSVETGAHKSDYVRASELEAAVLGALRADLANLPTPPLRPRRGRRPTPTSGRRRAAELRAELTDLAEARFFRREELRRSNLTREQFEFEMALIERKAALLEKELCGLVAGRAGTPKGAGEGIAGDRQRALRALMGLTGPVSALRQLLAALVERVVVHSADQVDINTAYAAEELAVPADAGEDGFGPSGQVTPEPDRGPRSAPAGSRTNSSRRKPIHSD